MSFIIKISFFIFILLDLFLTVISNSLNENILKSENSTFLNTSETESSINSDLLNSNITEENNRPNIITYKEQQKISKLNERMNNFYKKATSDFSENKLKTEMANEKITILTNRTIKVNDIVLDIPSNHTISSFDNIFPYFDQIKKLFSELNIDSETENIIRFMLNYNYIYYLNIDDTNLTLNNVSLKNKFFKVMMKQISDKITYVPFWENENIQLIERLRPNDELSSHFKHNLTSIFTFFKKLRNEMKDINKKIVFDRLRVFELLNVAYSKTFPITLKGFKVIKKLSNRINVKDIENYGVIFIPITDEIRNENLNYFTKEYKPKGNLDNLKCPEENDLIKSNIEFTSGSIIIKASRNFQINEEFTLNYDHSSGLLDQFRKKGTVSLESILPIKNPYVLNNCIYKHDIINLSNLSYYAKRLLLSLNSISGDPQGNTFIQTVFVNSFNDKKLNLYRIQNIKENITEQNVFEYRQNLASSRVPFIEAYALQDFIRDYYKQFIYSINYKVTIDDLLKIYSMSKTKTKLSDIATFMGYSGISFSSSSNTEENHIKLRESLKLFFISQHNSVLNINEALNRLENLIEIEFINIKKRILSKK